ncbi:MAG: hypothetical protein ACYSSI_01285 [Planctomycetota bacterium]
MASVGILHILICSLIPLSISFLLSRILIAANYQNKDLYALTIGLIVSIISTVILTFRFGYFGTGVAVLISMTVLSVLHYFMVRRYVFRLNYFFLISKPFVAAISMVVFLFFFKKSNPYLISIMSLFLYFGVLVSLKTFAKRDLDFFYMLQKEKCSI